MAVLPAPNLNLLQSLHRNEWERTAVRRGRAAKLSTHNSTTSPTACTSPPAEDASPEAQEKGEALVLAAMKGHTSDVEALLASGADPCFESSQNDSNMTALMWAAAEGFVPTVQVLIDAGANVNARNSRNLSALFYAIDNLPSSNPREMPPPGFPNISKQEAAPRPGVVRMTGHLEVARLLLQNGADIGLRNVFEETLLHMAARKSCVPLMRELLVRGLSIDTTSTGFLETALHVAAKEGHVDVVNLLCDLGANLEARSRFGWTPMLWAAACGWESVVRELIRRGADVNTFADGEPSPTTPLKEAVRCPNGETIRGILIRAGARE